MNLQRILIAAMVLIVLLGCALVSYRISYVVPEELVGRWENVTSCKWEEELLSRFDGEPGEVRMRIEANGHAELKFFRVYEGGWSSSDSGSIDARTWGRAFWMSYHGEIWFMRRFELDEDELTIWSPSDPSLRATFRRVRSARASHP